MRFASQSSIGAFDAGFDILSMAASGNEIAEREKMMVSKR